MSRFAFGEIGLMIQKVFNQKKNLMIYCFIFLLLSNLALYLLLKNKLEIPTDTINSYFPSAISLLEGRGYTVEGQFNAHHTPMFSLLIAICCLISGTRGYSNIIYPLIVLVLQSLTGCILFKITRENIGTRAGLLAGALLSSHPFFLVLTATKYAWTAQPLCLFFFILAVMYFFQGLTYQKNRHLFAAGFFLGMAALTWAGFAYAPVVFLFYIFALHYKKSRVFLFATFFALGFLLPTGFWSVYASQKTGKKIFISNADSVSMIDGLVRHDYSKLKRYAVVKRATKKRERGEIITSRDVMAFYESEIKKFPMDFVKWAAYKASRAWYGTDSEEHEKLNLVIQTPYLLLGVYGLFLCVLERRREVWLFLGLIFYFWGISFFVLTTIRYMMPAFMIWMIFVGYGVDRLWKMLSVKKSSKSN